MRTWLQAIAVIFMPLGSVIYTWIATRDKDNSQHIKAVEAALGARIADHASRLDRLERDISHMPTSADIADLKADLKAMQATQEASQREVHGIRLTSNRIEDYLLNKRTT